MGVSAIEVINKMDGDNIPQALEFFSFPTDAAYIWTTSMNRPIYRGKNFGNIK
jgi:hypothetical protein